MNQLSQTHQPGRPQSQQQVSPMQPPGSMGSRTGGYDNVTSPSGFQGPTRDFTTPPSIGQPQRPPSGSGHERSFSHGAMLNQASMQPQSQYNARNSIQAPPPQSRFGGLGGPPQLGALPFQNQSAPRQSPTQPGPSMGFQPPTRVEQSPARSKSPPNTVAPKAEPTISRGPVFGISLERLYDNSRGPVPMVVSQCIQAVDLYGLTVEGIYRLSGSSAHVNKLKHLFDTSMFPPFII